jgi:hypothetical protein
MKNKFKIIALTNIILLVLSLFIYRHSEIYRGQNPLYTSLKMAGLVLLISSITWSIVNTIFILVENRKVSLNYLF